MISIVALVWLVVLYVGNVRASFCYWPNNAVATNTRQCGSQDWCCYSGDTCMSNGLCRDINNHANSSMEGLYQVESCVNQNSTGCLTFCQTPTSGDRVYLWACNDALTTFCCDGGVLSQRHCCGNPDVTLAAAQVLSTAVATTPSSTVKTTTSGPTSLTTSLVSSGSVGTTTTSSVSSGSTSSTASASLSLATNAVTTDSSGNKSLSTGATIGIAVGCALVGFLLLGLLSLFIFKKRRGNQSSLEHADGHVRPAPLLMNTTTSGWKGPIAYQRDIDTAPTEKSHRMGLGTDIRSMGELQGSDPAELGAEEVTRNHRL